MRGEYRLRVVRPIIEHYQLGVRVIFAVTSKILTLLGSKSRMSRISGRSGLAVACVRTPPVLVVWVVEPELLDMPGMSSIKSITMGSFGPGKELPVSLPSPSGM